MPAEQPELIASDAPGLPPQPLARGAQCDATGRVVNVELRMSSTRGHVKGAPDAVYHHRIGSSGSLATNLKDDTKNTCDADDQKRHRAQATFPVTIKCLPPVQQPGMPVDPSKPCQAEVTPGTPTFTHPAGAGATATTRSDFTGTYHLGTRWVRITDGLGSAGREKIEDYGNRRSSCFFHAGTTHTPAHWCITRADTHFSVMNAGPLDLERGTRSFVVGLGAGFSHSHDNPGNWNININGVWAGGGYGPVNVGISGAIDRPAADESTAWLGYAYVAQCGADGKPYLVERNVAPANTSATTVDYDWTPEQIAATKLCDEVMARAEKAMQELAAHPDLLGDATILRARVRARDIDCKEADKLIAGLLRNKAARDKAAALRQEHGADPNAANVLIAIQALTDWLASGPGRYAPDPELGNLLKAIDAALANLDMINTLVGLQELYPAGELPAFDTAVADLLAYLRGPGPHDPAVTAARYKDVQDRLAELLKNRLCVTRAQAALPWDQKRMLDLIDKEPYVQKIKDLVAAAQTALGVRGLTCAQVTTITTNLQAAMQRVFIHARGDKMATTLKLLNGPGCQASGRAAFGEACDAFSARMKAIEFADKTALDAAYAELIATKKRLCDPPPRVIPVEQRLPPIVVPPLPGVPPPDGDGDNTSTTTDGEILTATTTEDVSVIDQEIVDEDNFLDDNGDLEVMEQFDEAELDALIGCDDLAMVDDADVALLGMLGGDPAVLGDDPPWFAGDWLAAMVAGDVAGELIEADAPQAPTVGEVPGEVCDLQHEPPSWPTDDPCEGCVSCSEDGTCSLMSGYDAALCEP